MNQKFDSMMSLFQLHHKALEDSNLLPGTETTTNTIPIKTHKSSTAPVSSTTAPPPLGGFKYAISSGSILYLNAPLPDSMAPPSTSLLAQPNISSFVQSQINYNDDYCYDNNNIIDFDPTICSFNNTEVQPTSKLSTTNNYCPNYTSR